MVRRSHRRWSLIASSGLGGSSGGGSAHNRATSPPSRRQSNKSSSKTSASVSPPPKLKRCRTDSDALLDMKKKYDDSKNNNNTPAAGINNGTKSPPVTTEAVAAGPSSPPRAGGGVGGGADQNNVHTVAMKRPSCTTLTVNDIRRSVSIDYDQLNSNSNHSLSAGYLTNDSSSSGGGGSIAGAEYDQQQQQQQQQYAGGNHKYKMEEGNETGDGAGAVSGKKAGKSRRTSLSNITSGWGAKIKLKKKITRRASMTHPANNNRDGKVHREGRLSGNNIRRSSSTGEEHTTATQQRRAGSATTPLTPLDDILRPGEGKPEKHRFGSVPLNLNSIRTSSTNSNRGSTSSLSSTTRSSLTSPRKNWSFNRGDGNNHHHTPISLLRSSSTGSKSPANNNNNHHGSSSSSPGKNWPFHNSNAHKDTTSCLPSRSHSHGTTKSTPFFSTNTSTTTTAAAAATAATTQEKELDLDDLVKSKSDHEKNSNAYIHPSFLHSSWSSSGALAAGGGGGGGGNGNGGSRNHGTSTNAQPSIQMIPRNVVRAPAMATKMVVRGSVMAGESVVQAVRVSAGGASAVVDAATKASFAVVDVGTKAGNAVVDASTRASTSIKNKGQAVVEGTTQAVACGANQMISGGRAVVEGTTQVVMDGTKQVFQTSTNIVAGGSKVLVESTQQGGKMVYQGGRNFGKRLKRIASKGHHPFQLPKSKRQKSRWEESVEVIDELLDPKSPTYAVMTEEQRRKLGTVKRVLLKGTGNGDMVKTQHVPQELVRIQSMPKVEDGGDAFEYDDEGNPISRRCSTNGMRRNSTFILQEYAGVTNADSLVMNDDSRVHENEDLDDDNVSHPFASAADVTDDERSVMTRALSAASTVSNDCCSDDEDEDLVQDNDNDNEMPPPEGSIVPGPITRAFSVDKDFLPAEFTYMEYAQQKELSKLLSWDSMLSWDFDVFRLNEVTNGRPLLFLGWALLSAPYAQEAMERELGVNTTTNDAAASSSSDDEGYPFVKDLSIPFNKLCNYLRTIEADYTAANPYHNAIHAADVLQTIHALIQMSKEEDLLKDVPPIKIFAILLGAVVHDVEHPGKTNAFHIKVRSELAVNYNDSSVLENHHIAHAFARMLNLDLRGAKAVIDGASVKARICFKYDQNSDCNILCNATGEQFDTIRKLMIDAILHTDMTKHFAMVNSARGMLMEEEPCKKEEQSWKLLVYMLHMADISSQAKGSHLFKKWSLRCLEEFFLQGDEEADLGLPVSPLCDRNNTSIPESQVGFIKYVVEPSFAVLAQYSSFVQEKVLPIIDSNLTYWFAEQEGLENEGAPPATEIPTTKESIDEEDDKAEVQPPGSPSNGAMADGDDDSESYGSDYSF